MQQVHGKRARWLSTPNTVTRPAELRKELIFMGLPKKAKPKKESGYQKGVLDIRMIGASPSLYSTDKASKKPNDFTIFADSIADIQKALAPR
ncbi:hypothetical protein N7451_012171 [Penicillium sp. IBT 35674x]|nr:hypothetical protein N7451_012171 [Penicillium sp. IBT 35674x]